MPVTNIHEGISLNGLLPHCRQSISDEDFFDAANSRLLYSRGFVFCKKPDVKINKHFTRVDVCDGYYLYHHFLLQPTIYYSFDRKSFVLLMGTAWFTNSDHVCDDKNEAQILLDRLTQSDSEFFNALNYLAGRYAVICKNNDKIFAVNDPCGLRSIYYCKESECIGSHLELVNLIAKRQESEVERHRKEEGYSYTYSYPGNHTLYDGIFSLIPDFALYLDTYETKRFFPTAPILKTDNVKEIRDLYFEKMDLSMRQILKKGKKICFSITGGKDSKVSFYTTKNYKDKIFYFTEARDNDIELAKRLVKEYDLNWMGTDSKDVKLKENPYFKAYNEILKRNIFPVSSMDALQNMFWNLNIFGFDSDYLHIHSNCAEAGRGRPLNGYEMAYAADDFCFEKFFDAYISSAVSWKRESVKQEISKRMHEDQFLKKVLKDFFDMLDLKYTKTLNYNPWDIMYIEQRCSTFLSQMHMLNDALYDNVSLTCSREILSLMWRLPDEYINQTCVLYNSILNENDTVYRTENMGEKFVPSNSQEEKDDYHLIYAGYALTSSTPPREKMALAEKVLKINNTVKWAHSVLINESIRSADYNKAAQAWVDLYDVAPELARKHINSGDAICNILRQNNRLEYVKHIVNFALERDPGTAWAYKQLSHIYEQKGELHVALSLAEKSFSYAGQDRWIAQNYISLLMKTGDMKKADAILSKCLQENEKSFWGNLCRAMYCYKLNDHANALNYSDKALSMNPNDKTAIHWNKLIKDSVG